MEHTAQTYKALLEYACLAIVILLIALLFSRCEYNSTNSELVQNNIYSSAYEEGYESGYYAGYTDAKICEKCGNSYGGSFSFGFGLCNDCGRSSVTDCAFCFKPTIAWADSDHFTVCPNCLGAALKSTDIENILIEFNESR